MEKACWIVFGALLSVLGGFLTHLYQNWLSQKRKDRELLLQAEEILYEAQYLFIDLPETSKEIAEARKKLHRITRKIRSRSYLDLALKLAKFCEEPMERTTEKAFNLVKEIEKETRSPLNMYHRKRDEIIKKSWEELKRIGRG